MIRSEAGLLRTVIVHRPGLELDRLTPSNKDELLFDELIWVEKAQNEHDAFVATMIIAGVDVLYLTNLLETVLADGNIAEAFISEQVGDDLCGRRLAGKVRGLLTDLDTGGLVNHLIGGVSFGDVGETDGLVAALHGPDDFVLAPIPNAVFMRDSSVWVGDGVILSPMNRIVRRRETALLKLVYQHHPRFAGVPIWFGDRPGDHFPASVEGGDILVVGDRGLAVGISERTSPSGASAMISRLFEEDVVDRVLAVELPKGRATMHLDTVVSMVDGDAVVIYPRIQARVRCFRVTPGEGGYPKTREVAGLAEGLAWAAGIPRMRVIEPTLRKVEADREQWNDANNTFAIAPGEVVAYERNVVTNRILEDAGVIVHRIPSYELPRGRGGPRCMTCPVDREPVAG
ncbi:MAG: arginine deiminase [Actinobacteria bacterium]|nr:arginine deiminase [Actinomycetota bacterium]